MPNIPGLQVFILSPANRYGHTPMTAPQFFPIPPEMLAFASQTVTQKVSRLPFLRSGVMVNGELLGVTLECLNAEPAKTLALLTPRDAQHGAAEGLDRCLAGRLRVEGRIVSPIIADVLVSAGIAEPANVTERSFPQPRKALRLLPPWTWHIASILPHEVKLARSGAIPDPSASWLNLCPVCRTGRLNRVFGKQLFGVPHTDFIIECTHCGAKFIPVGPAFRLVSIASIRDPLWKRYLDQTYPPETWAALARGTSPGGNPVSRPRPQPATAKSSLAPSGNLAVMKDGSLAVPVDKKTVYFRPVPLTFSGGMRMGIYSRVQKTVRELLEDPAFSHLRDPVNAKYSNYLPQKAGLFLSHLEERHDPFYREFLNPYGDEKFGSFRAAESGDIDKAGILLVVVNRGIYAARSSPGSFRAMINEYFGRILPEHCLVGGDEFRCRINAVLCNNHREAGLYIYPLGAKEEQARLAGLLEKMSYERSEKNNP